MNILTSPLALRYVRFHRIQTRLVVDLHQVDLLIAVREIICRNILSAVFGWYDMVYERSGAERHRDVLSFRGNVLVIDSLSFFFFLFLVAEIPTLILQGKLTVLITESFFSNLPQKQDQTKL